MRAGWSLDLTTKDENGRSWDFNKFEMRNAAVREVLKDRPTLRIGSPICTPFSVMNNINYTFMSPEEVDAPTITEAQLPRGGWFTCANCAGK